MSADTSKPPQATALPSRRYHHGSLIGAAVACFATGLIPNFPLHFLSLFGWIPLFVVCIGSSSLFEVFLWTLCVNLCLCVVGFFWLLLVNDTLFLPAVFLTFWFLPVYFVIGKVALRLLQNPLRAFQPFIWAILWLGYIWIFSKTPANEMPLLGFFSFPLNVLQSIRFISYSELTAIWVFASAGIACFALDPTSRGSRMNLFLALALSVFIVVVGHSQFSFQNQAVLRNLRIAVIQHNHDYDDTRQAAYLPEFEKLAEEAAHNHPLDLIIFPLYTLSPSEQEELLRPNGYFDQLANRLHTSILIGTRLPAERLPDAAQRALVTPNSFFVSALLFSPDQTKQIYHSVDKSALHDADQVLSTDYHVLNLQNLPIGVLLCYECARPKWARLAAQQGARILVGLSNPADAPHSYLPYYTLRLSQMRAIESKLPMILSSPNGFSGLINSAGKLIKRGHLRDKEILYFDAPIDRS